MLKTAVSFSKQAVSNYCSQQDLPAYTSPATSYVLMSSVFIQSSFRAFVFLYSVCTSMLSAVIALTVYS